MTEIHSTDPFPAAANLAQQPLTPEGLRDKFTGLVDNTFIHYESQKPSRSQTTRNPAAPWRTSADNFYHDGAVRQVIYDQKNRTTTHKVYLPRGVVDQYKDGRTVLLMAEQDSRGPTTYDLRFLEAEGAKKGPTTYRWSANEPVAEVLQGEIKRPLEIGTEQFHEASGLADQISQNWTALSRESTSGGYIKGRTAWELGATIVNKLFGGR